MATDPTSRFHLPPEMLFGSSVAAAPACDLFPITSYQGNSTPHRATRRIVFSRGDSQCSVDTDSCLLIDSVPRLKHDTGLAIEWSIDEQYKLEEGLAKYANEPNVMRYIKIANSIPEKTVRDVALRCTWMGRKRRKQEDQNQILGKKVTDGKELLESLKNSIASASSVNTFSLTTSNHDPSDSMISGVITSVAMHLIEENNQAFSQISANLSSLKLQQNINLFFHTKNNLSKILNEMKNTPGIMCRMAPLPVLINEELANRIFSPSSQPFSCPMVTCLNWEA